MPFNLNFNYSPTAINFNYSYPNLIYIFFLSNYNKQTIPKHIKTTIFVFIKKITFSPKF